MPLPQVIQFYHCALRASLQWTVSPSEKRSLSDGLVRLSGLAATLLAEDAED